MTLKKPRKNPCANCPYRRDVPSGIWDKSEYEKLPLFDKPLMEQPLAVFYCHLDANDVCAGWLGCHDQDELLGLRMGIGMERVSEECVTYETAVPLWGSGAEAAAHGMRDIDQPSSEASEAVQKILRVRKVRR